MSVLRVTKENFEQEVLKQIIVALIKPQFVGTFVGNNELFETFIDINFSFI